MARPAQDVTDAELALLQALWDRGASTVRQLTEAIYPGGKASQVATVQKLLERLEIKECVQRNKSGGVFFFTAVIGRDELIGRRLHDLAHKLCGGSLTPLLTNLVRAKRLSPREHQELLSMLETLDPAAKAKRART